MLKMNVLVNSLSILEPATAYGIFLRYLLEFSVFYQEFREFSNSS